MAKSSFERVIGGISDTEKEKILQGMEERFDDQEFDDLVGKEREKTHEELEIIDLANKVTNELRRKYGLVDFDIPPQNVHVIKESEWPEDKKGNATYISEYQGVAAREQDSNISFLKKTVHEMIHFKSYNAMQVTESEDPEAEEYRVGLTVHTRDGQVMYFRNLNEAVTEEITKNLISQLRPNPLIKREIQQTKALADRYPDAVASNGETIFGEDTYYAELLDETTLKDAIGRVFGGERSRKIAVEEFTYQRERRIFQGLIDKLFTRNAQTFHDRDEIVDLFKRSMMTGNILPLGRLIDGTFGKGTLRKIGELDSDITAQEEFVKSL